MEEVAALAGLVGRIEECVGGKNGIMDDKSKQPVISIADPNINIRGEAMRLRNFFFLKILDFSTACLDIIMRELTSVYEIKKNLSEFYML